MADPEGLERLAALVPVALDESLLADPALAQRWSGWQVRRPASEGDPRPLLAALQAQGPTPTAPGWRPQGDLFAADPERVWGAVG